MVEPRQQQLPEETMIAVITETMEQSLPGSRDRRPRVSLDSRLDSDLGLDSLTRAELLVAAERVFGVQLPEQLLSEADTPRDILNAVLRARGEQTGPTAPGASAAASAAGEADADAEAFTVPAFDTLQDALQWHAREHPRRTYLHWVKSRDDIEPLTFGELHDGALRVAQGLFQHDLERRDTVALMLPTSHDYFHGFFGVLYADAIPVPLYPPMRASQIGEHLRRQAAILNNARARIMITVPEAKQLATLLRGLVPSLEHVVTTADLWAQPMAQPVAGAAAADIAFLQYTSGSTGDPKGVTLTHANLFANIGASNEVIRVSPDDVFVSWLPLYHDMGLIGACLSSLWYGMHLVVMSPLLFLTRPWYWLWAIHHFGGTLSPAPNFGFELCLKRLGEAEMDGLDLSSWRVAFNGAEAVSPDTVTRFTDYFRRWGFRSDTMAPVYGLAENCVALTFPEAPRPPLIDAVDRERFRSAGEALPVAANETAALRFVSCGKAIPGHRIRIVGEQGDELPERHEGHIQFTGPSATPGYYRNPEKTRALYAGDWLNTGDRGYIADGELYISGRSKDLIVRGGRNLYPGEIEDAVGALEAVRSGCVAAFAAGMGEAGGEKLVVVAESHVTDAASRGQLRREITGIAMDTLGIDVDEVVIVPPRTIPKTSSGKLRRNDTRLLYEAGKLEQPALPLWRQLARLVRVSWRQQLRQGARALGRWFYAGWGWTAFALVALGVVILVNVLPRPGWRWRVCHRAARMLAWLTGTRLRVAGGEILRRLPDECVIVANHASYLDALLVTAAVPVPVRFVAKAELLRYPVLRRVLLRLGVEPVDRSSQQSSVRASRRIAERARRQRLMYFVEGGFDASPGLRPFHMGAFMTAAVLGEPVYPIALGGTRRKLPADRWNPRPGPLTVQVGEPVTPAGDDWRSAVQLRDHCRQQILAMTGEPDTLRPRG